MHPILDSAFQDIIDRVSVGIEGHDQVRMVLHTPQLQYPIALPFMRRDQLTANRFLSRVEQVLQSHENFRLNESVQVNFFHVSMPHGSGKGRRKIINLEQYLENKRCIVRIQNKDELCLARACAGGGQS